MSIQLQIKSLAFQVFLVCLQIQLNEAQIAYLYKYYDLGGSKLRIRLDQCYNLINGWPQTVSSIDTMDNCARLYSGKNCDGDSIEILPNSPSHNDLRKWRFDDTTRSYGPCRDSCNENVTGTPPLNPIHIQLFRKVDFEGPFKNISVNGCTLIPEDFVPQIKSVRTNGYCIQIYDNKKCETGSKFLDRKSIELRSGTPFHNNFEKWNFPNSKALSHCSYKCTDRKTFVSTTPLPGNKTIPGYNQSETFNKSKLHEVINVTEFESVQKSSSFLIKYFPLIYIVPLVIIVTGYAGIAFVIIGRFLIRGGAVRVASAEEMRYTSNNLGLECINGTTENPVDKPHLKLNITKVK